MTQKLLHPSSGIPREYEATVVGHVDHSVLKAKLSAGVDTTEGRFSAVLLDHTEVSLLPCSELLPRIDAHTHHHFALLSSPSVSVPHS